MIKVSVLGLVILSLVSTTQAQPNLPVLAVFEVENCKTPLTPEEVSALGEFLASKLGEHGRYRLIPRNEMRERLLSKKKESHQACYDQGCQIEIGRELAANFSVSTMISQVGNTCVITSAMYDLAKAVTVKTASAKGPCSANDLLTAMEQVAAGFFKTPGTPEPAATPAPTTRPVSLASTLFGIQFITMPAIHIENAYDHPLAGQAGIYLGIDANIDFFISQWFFFGLSARFGVGDNLTIGHVTLRSGSSFRLAEHVLLSPYLQGGVSLWEYPENTMVVGWMLGAGATLRYMFSRSLGMSADLLLAYDSTDNDQNQDEPRAWALLSAIGVGFYAGF